MKSVIEIIVNKSWEVEPFLAAMTDGKIKPIELPIPDVLLSPRVSGSRMASCRAEYHLKNINVIVRCIEDLMDPDKSASNSEEKYRVLPDYIKADKPSLVISVSTAESTPAIQPEDDYSENGSVFIGGIFYMFDGHPFDPGSGSNLKIPVEYQQNNIPQIIYDLMDDNFGCRVVSKFSPAKNFPANYPKFIAKPLIASIGVINITNYKAYESADSAAYNAFIQKQLPGIPATIETTHGIVRMSAGNIPTLFVSPITDRYMHFDDDVDKEGVQNRIAANNAGVAVAELLVELNKYYSPKNS